MTLDEARAIIEAKFTVYPEIGDSSRSATNEPYAVIVSGGVKGDGETSPILCATPELAIQFWLDAALKYADGKTGTLYWRIPPEIDSEIYVPKAFVSIIDKEPYWAKELWCVYARFLISDKPVVRPAKFLEVDLASVSH